MSYDRQFSSVLSTAIRPSGVTPSFRRTCSMSSSFRTMAGRYRTGRPACAASPSVVFRSRAVTAPAYAMKSLSRTPISDKNAIIPPTLVSKRSVPRNRIRSKPLKLRA